MSFQGDPTPPAAGQPDPGCSRTRSVKRGWNPCGWSQAPVEEAKDKTYMKAKPSLRSDLTGIRQHTRPCWSDHENTAKVFLDIFYFSFAESLKVLCLWCPAHTHPYNLQSLVCECGSEIVYLCLWDCSGRTADLQMCVFLFFISLKSNNSRNWLFDESNSALND